LNALSKLVKSGLQRNSLICIFAYKIPKRFANIFILGHRLINMV